MIYYNINIIFEILKGKENNLGYFLVNNEGDGTILIDDGESYKVAVDDNKVGNYIKLTAIPNTKDKATCELLSATVIDNNEMYFQNGKTNIYFKNEDVNTNSKYNLVECNINFKKETGESCMLIEAHKDKNYYVGEQNNSLIEILRDDDRETIKDIYVINKYDLITGYYLNKDRTAVVCINGQGCIDADDNYISDSCNDEHLGKLVMPSDNEEKYLYLCSSVEITASAIYITAVNNDAFPDSKKGYISVKYNSNKHTILKVEKNEKCTEDGKIIFTDNSFYYCTNVAIHETYHIEEIVGQNVQILDEELTRYESVPISLNSICTSTSIDNGYVINGANKINLIKCSSNNCNSISGSVSNKTKYYINVSTYDKSSKSLINCNNGNDCGTIAGGVGYYYLDEDSKSTTGDTYSKIIYCSSTTSCSNETINNGYVINGANKINLIMCSASSCQSIDASESGKTKYYLNDYDYEKTKMPLILCDNGSACVTSGGENGTYYLDEDSKSTTGDIYTKVIYCSSNTSNNISCTSTTISNGYVINGADKKKVIKWSDTSCNSMDASESSKILFKCINI